MIFAIERDESGEPLRMWWDGSQEDPGPKPVRFNRKNAGRWDSEDGRYQILEICQGCFRLFGVADEGYVDSSYLGPHPTLEDAQLMAARQEQLEVVDEI